MRDSVVRILCKGKDTEDTVELQHGKLQRPQCDVYNPEPTHSTEPSPETQQVGGCCKIPHCVGPSQVKAIGNSRITKQRQKCL